MTVNRKLIQRLKVIIAFMYGGILYNGVLLYLENATLKEKFPNVSLWKTIDSFLLYPLIVFVLAFGWSYFLTWKKPYLRPVGWSIIRWHVSKKNNRRIVSLALISVFLFICIRLVYILLHVASTPLSELGSDRNSLLKVFFLGSS